MRISALNPIVFIIGILSLPLLVACAMGDASPTPTGDLEAIATKVAVSRTARAISIGPTMTPSPTSAQVSTPSPTQRANIIQPGYSLSNPLNIVTPIIVEFEDLLDVLSSLSSGKSPGISRAKITVLDIDRGEQVWLSLYLTNRDNTPPFPGFEYIAAWIRFEFLEGPDSYGIRPNAFQVVSSKGQEYDLPPYFVFEYQPSLNALLYPGDSHTGYAAFQVPKNDPYPLLTFSSIGHQQVWLKLFDDT